MWWSEPSRPGGSGLARVLPNNSLSGGLGARQKCLSLPSGRKDELEESQLYDIGIPFSLMTQRRLLIATGFKNIEVIYEESDAAILIVNK